MQLDCCVAGKPILSQVKRTALLFCKKRSIVRSGPVMWRGRSMRGLQWTCSFQLSKRRHRDLKPAHHCLQLKVGVVPRPRLVVLLLTVPCGDPRNYKRTSRNQLIRDRISHQSDLPCPVGRASEMPSLLVSQGSPPDAHHKILIVLEASPRHRHERRRRRYAHRGVHVHGVVLVIWLPMAMQT